MVIVVNLHKIVVNIKEYNNLINFLNDHLNKVQREILIDQGEQTIQNYPNYPRYHSNKEMLNVLKDQIEQKVKNNLPI